MLRYKIIKQRNALDENKKEMYYPRLTGRTKYDINDIADLISKQSSLSKADVIATLVSLETLIPDLLTIGYTIKLGELGTFSLQANTQISEKEDQVTWRSFKKLIVRFKAGKALKILLQDVNFKKA